MKKTKVIIVAVLLVLVAILVIPIGLGDEVESPFGSWRFEVISTDSEGNIHPMSVVNTVGGQMLQWTHGGSDIETVTLKLYASAIGEGYDYCDIDCTASSMPGPCFYVIPNLCYIDTDEVIHCYNGGYALPINDAVRLTINGPEVLVIESVTNMADFGLSSGDTQIYTLDWYFCAYPLRYRGVTGDTPDDWQEEDITITVESDVEVTWEEEVVPFCGDGTCSNEPYPGENCKTCTEDCGSCDAEMKNVYTTVSSGLTKDDGGLAFHYGYDDYSWSDWGYPSTPYHIEVFKNADAWSLWVWTGDGTSGKILKSSCKIVCSGITYYPIMCTWSEDGTAVSPGNWYQIGYWTYWENAHVLLSNSQYYKLYLDVWLEGDGEQTNNPVVTITFIDPLIDPMNEPTVVEYRIEDADGHDMDTTVIQWDSDGSDTYYDESEGYSMIHTHSHQWSFNYASSHTGATVNIACTDPDGLIGTASSWVSFWTGLQIYSGGTFSIVDTGSNDYTPYVNGENYLGVI